MQFSMGLGITPMSLPFFIGSELLYPPLPLVYRGEISFTREAQRGLGQSWYLAGRQ